MKIERYGVVALVFLVLTFVAATFWEEGDSVPGSESRTARADASTTWAAKQGLPPARVPEGPPLWRREDERPSAGQADLAADRAFAAGGEKLREQAEREAALRRRRLEERGRRVLGLEEEVVREVAGAVRGAEKGAGAGRNDRPSAPKTHSAPAAIFDERRVAALEERARARGQALPAASAAPALKSAPRDGGAQLRTVTVRPGDTLSEISLRELGTSKRWREIASLNGITDASRLFVGQVLRLPGDVPRTASAERPPRAGSDGGTRHSPAPGANRVVVRPGDTLSRIALARLGDARRWREIAALNGISDPARLVVGRELVLPTGSSAEPRRGASSPTALASAASPPPRKKNRVQ